MLYSVGEPLKRSVSRPGDRLPFTPFHFGPGLLGKSLLARYFSWSAFIASQVFIDGETLYYILKQAYPLHRFFHTFFGAALAGLFIGIALIGIKSLTLKVNGRSVEFFKKLRPSLRSECSSPGLFWGAFIGGLSHPFLDGLMHQDIRPFAPWTNVNPLLGLIGWETLHLACLGLGVLGGGILLVRLITEKAA